MRAVLWSVSLLAEARIEGWCHGLCEEGEKARRFEFKVVHDHDCSFIWLTNIKFSTRYGPFALGSFSPPPPPLHVGQLFRSTLCSPVFGSFEIQPKLMISTQ